MSALIPVLFPQPVMTDLVERTASVFARRFHFQAYHADTLPAQLEACDSATILFAFGSELPCLESLTAPQRRLFHVVLLVEAGQTPQAHDLQQPWLVDYSSLPLEPERFVFLLNRQYSEFARQQQLQRLGRQLEVQRTRLQELNEIGAALSTERNLDNLLDKILRSSMEITHSDSCSLYLVENRAAADDAAKTPFANQCLRFKLARNMSLIVDFSEFTIDINEQSMAGFVALSGDPLVISDAYQIPSSAPFSFNKSFDLNTGYRSKSMLTVPMRNPKGEIIGILQMINKKRNWSDVLDLSDKAHFEQQIGDYEPEDEQLLLSLASQAAVAIENARLYEAIQSLFEGFIRASVQAIESRDPTTSGHSERVAVLTVELAKQVDRSEQPSFQGLQFSRDDLKEIKYASLLHDFGKIGVRENVLVKAEKLYPHELEGVRYRFRLARKSLEHEYAQKKLHYALEHDREQALQHFLLWDAELQTRLQDLDEDLRLVLQANQPTVLAEEASQKLLEIQQKAFMLDEQMTYLLEPYELSRLSITRGSLDPEERREIESHVTHTFHFLSQIPWTNELKHVPQIAYAHHEKLNGRGYPRALSAAEIPIQSRMMTIADIYDALTASDRPYKKALPVAKALDILGYEVKDGMLDGELYRLFVDSRAYELIMPDET
jgi:HD-GYP domain-containing protein (c-di-GMP phosphodiesterase class II)